MLPCPNPFAQDPEIMSFSPNLEEVNSHSALTPYIFYHPIPSPPPFSPSGFNYDFLFAADAFPPDASALPPAPDLTAGEEVVTVAAPPPAPRNPGPCGGRRKRFRTDRHSKIHTSQGLRDRRMRLSLSVARQFFWLQDMLGFDKASHTIDWLLKQSKSAIELLAESSARLNSAQTLNSGSFVTESSASECEVASSHSHHKTTPLAAASSKAKASAAAPSRVSREVAAIDRGLTRESREKARARARERTMEKKRVKSTRGFVDQQAGGAAAPPCEGNQISMNMNMNMNMNSSWFNMYSNEDDEGKLPEEAEKD